MIGTQEEVRRLVRTKMPFEKQVSAGYPHVIAGEVSGFESMRLSDGEIIRDYLLPARQFVERGLQAQGSALPAFNRKFSN